ncbi:hypothetical protein Ocin01_05124 [Orchesella cincta]|uniref:BRO1 domain-containing protein n=1 Tax=Orchesella cincta TaxID=48709 RepID=A0A1D2N8F7_ORCCI|nr:hypothetical protein Ocin01_05124 [Orchesella cincta]
MSDQLLSVPVKVSSEIDISTPLKAALKQKGYRPLEAEWFQEFEKLRNLSVDKNLSKNQASVETLNRYYDQLAVLHDKNLGNIPNLSLYWESSLEKGGFFGGKYYTYSSNLEFERVAVLYNIGAIQSALGADYRASNNDEGLKNAAKCYQNAAGIFINLCETKQETLGITEGYTLTNDLNSDALSALAALMVAQAQEMFVTKAILDSMKDGIVAKLCAQAEDLYKDAILKLKKDNVRSLWESTWMNHAKGKQLAFEGLSQFFQSKVCGTKKLIGEQLGRLTLSLDLLKKAQDKLGAGGFVTKFIAEAEKQYSLAKKDNDMIYLELVPPAEKLDPIDRVASARLAKALPCPEKLSTNFKDIFEGMAIDPNAVNPPTLKSIFGSTVQALGKYVEKKLLTPENK